MAKTTTKISNGANLGFEQILWKAADKMRGSMDPSEYKHVALGLMFLKYISDGFEEHYQKLVSQSSSGADPEDRDEYKAENVFWVPQNARWTFLQNNAIQPNIGTLIDRRHRDFTEEDIAKITPPTPPGNPVLGIPTSPAFAIPLPSRRSAPRATLSLLVVMSEYLKSTRTMNLLLRRLNVFNRNCMTCLIKKR